MGYKSPAEEEFERRCERADEIASNFQMYRGQRSKVEGDRIVFDNFFGQGRVVVVVTEAGEP